MKTRRPAGAGALQGRARIESLALILLAGLVLPTFLGGQELARRIRGVENGLVRLTYPTRPGVEICDEGIRVGQRRMMWHSRGWDNQPTNCRSGSAEVEVALRQGRVRDVELLLRARDRTEDAEDMGPVSAPAAAEFFLEVARRGGSSGRGLEDALLPAVLADVEGLWQDLLNMAQDPTVQTDVRTASLFWVGQQAADVVTEGLAEVALDEKEDQEVREAAVFALSQRPSDEGVPILMEVARTAEHPETRRSAMFWLAQSKDERVFAFFEGILLGRGGG